MPGFPYTLTIGSENLIQGNSMKFTAAAIQMLASDDKAANLAEAGALDSPSGRRRRQTRRLAGSFYLARR